jgi:hypothetical protein
MSLTTLRGGGETTTQTETHAATNLSKTLLSIADLHEGGEWDLSSRGGKRGGAVLSKFDAQNKAVHEIPVRWDYDDHVPRVDYELQPKNKNKRKINMVNETKEKNS